MIIIVGSRREGNSFLLAQKIKEEMDKERIHTEIITPGNQTIHVCTGCMDCDKDGICDFTDDMKENIEKLKKEDLIVFITPTRWNLLSGDLKIFMDRLNPMYARRQLSGKKMIAITIGAQEKGLFSSEAALTSLLSFAQSAKMDCILKKEFYGCLKDKDILEKEDETSKLIEDIKMHLKK